MTEITRSEGEGAFRHALPPELIHDMRTPLTHIIGYSEMLIEQAEEAGDDRYLADLQKINAAGYKLLALFNENLQSVRAAMGPTASTPPVEGIASAMVRKATLDVGQGPSREALRNGPHLREADQRTDR